MRKQIITGVLGLTILTAFVSGCGTKKQEKVSSIPSDVTEASNKTLQEETTVTPTEITSEDDVKQEEETISETQYVFAPKDGYDSAGYVSFVCETTGEYQFKELIKGVTTENEIWKVYVIDEEFEDALRFIGQAYTENLVGNGSLTITEGQYVYIHCEQNSFTGIEPDANMIYMVSLK